MDLSEMRFPRHLEAEYDPDMIRRVLMNHAARLWPGGNLHVAVIATGDQLKKALQEAMLKGGLRLGLEGASAKLRSEKAGIDNISGRSDASHGTRISRLILLSNDGSERLYRHVEQLLLLHTPRVLGCLLDMDSSAFGKAITTRDKEIKVVMAEHKDVVSGILRAVLDGRCGIGETHRSEKGAV
jgi:hypothetical protein